MNDKLILIIDDDKNICELLQMYLLNAGFTVQTAHNGKTAFAKLEAEKFDIVLLDVMLPDTTGWELCRRIKEGCDTPVIMITARDMLQDKIQGFHCGADDYIVKPFEPMEVIARVNARLRERKPKEMPKNTDLIALDGITLDMRRYEVRKNGAVVELKPKEVQLLHFLLTNKNIVFSRDTLLNRVWNYDISGDTRTVDVHIQTLRQKLWDESASWKIKTVWGVGYKLEV